MSIRTGYNDQDHNDLSDPEPLTTGIVGALFADSCAWCKAPWMIGGPTHYAAYDKRARSIVSLCPTCYDAIRARNRHDRRLR